MKILIFLIMLNTVSVFAEDPRFPSPTTPDQIWQNDKDLNDSIKSLHASQLKVLTKTQITGLTPARLGQIYFCSDCTSAIVCVSTGTLLGQFSNITVRTAGCN